MERLKQMKENLMACVSNQVCGNLAQVDTKELGEAIDMIKDLEEAIYYCTITKAMEEKPNEGKHQERPQYYTTEKIYPKEYNMNGRNGKMYYNGGGGYSSGGNSSGNSGNYSYYSSGRDGDGNSSGMKDGQDTSYFDPMLITDYRDIREGNSPYYRKMYMESKELHHDKSKQIQELENYMQELSKDVTDMIKDASPEEKQILQQKLNMLASKIK